MRIKPPRWPGSKEEKKNRNRKHRPDPFPPPPTPSLRRTLIYQVVNELTIVAGIGAIVRLIEL